MWIDGRPREDQDRCVSRLPERDRGFDTSAGVARDRHDGVDLVQRVGYVEVMPDPREDREDRDRAEGKAPEETAHPGWNGAGMRPGGLARARRSTHRASLLEARGAVHRPIGARLERHLARFATVAADDLVHALHPRGGALGLGASAAIGAPLRLVEQAFLRVEILLADGPNEGVAAFATAQALVREGHRHPP